jgi:tetraacyldisaccharide 4'-kinase
MWYSMRNYFRRLAEGSERGWLASLFVPLVDLASRLYGAAVGGWRMLYDKGILKRTRLPFPVISVGNLTWGGTGKTPLVEYLARRTAERNCTPLILTRGYSHDEVEQLKRQLPRAVIGVGKNRTEVALRLTQQQPVGLAILDDGLQHFPLERDLDVVTFNALNPFGNGKLIPRGILREPLSVLAKASVIVITHANLVEDKALQELRENLARVAPAASMVEACLEPLFFYRAKKRMRIPVERLQNQRVTTFAGIGMPRSFQALLARFHIKPVRNFEFPDHHCFTSADLLEIKRVSDSASVDEIITTEKDYCRNAKLIADLINPLILATRLRISRGEDILVSKINALTGGAWRAGNP